MLSGLVLAGGKSSRMQQDKALLDFHGVTLLEHTQRQLFDAGCHAIMISRNQDGCIKDMVANAGPLGGIHAALHHARDDDALLVMPVDMPFVSIELLQTLIETGFDSERPCYFDDCYLPLYLPVSDKARRFLDKLLASDGQGRVRQLLNYLDAIVLPIADRTPLRNLNTPADWQQALTSTE
ncbi:molybdenum cofactor guanylyltransferase [Gallaecimonas mangrovi]|uniref:molybdenum cofactor guanylyltransferase n=1 Tax=Gallaecimonas mangrovi TaxID=2291597 RepID=UPI000E20AFF6|nr:molybdenum cofactor guanylyltransferase [Gallaecimonas mangrovi]